MLPETYSSRPLAFMHGRQVGARIAQSEVKCPTPDSDSGFPKFLTPTPDSLT